MQRHLPGPATMVSPITFYFDETFTDVTSSSGFPNTLDTFTPANPGANGHNNTSATGTNVPTGTVPSTYNFASGNGLTGSVDLSALNAELAAAKATIPMLNSVDNPNASFGRIDLGASFSDGSIDKSMHLSDKGFGVSGDISATASSGCTIRSPSKRCRRSSASVCKRAKTRTPRSKAPMRSMTNWHK